MTTPPMNKVVGGDMPAAIWRDFVDPAGPPGCKSAAAQRTTPVSSPTLLARGGRLVAQPRPSSHEAHFRAMAKPASSTDLGAKLNDLSWPKAEGQLWVGAARKRTSRLPCQA